MLMCCQTMGIYGILHVILKEKQGDDVRDRILGTGHH